MTDVQLLILGALIGFGASILTAIITKVIDYWIEKKKKRRELINTVSEAYAYGEFRFNPNASITKISRERLPDIEKLSMTELSVTMGHIRAQVERGKEQRNIS